MTHLRRRHSTHLLWVLQGLVLLYILRFASPLQAKLPIEVAEILQNKCLSCHNPEAKKGGLSLHRRSVAIAGGDSGEVIVPGDPESSYLLELITSENGKAEMPKGSEPLSAAEVATLRKWIQAGAVWPDDVELQAERWWSFQELRRPAIPELPADADAGWARTAIDHFVLHRLAKHGLSPSPTAGRRTLIRRLFFDLLGLPPTPAQIREFQDDDRVDAYDRLVERLLASPAYGERWARHWLDVVKYADTCGYDKDKLRPNAYPYRDYVIRSLNADKQYTQFVHEQIAGDVFRPQHPDGILGLGFLAAGPWDFIGHVEVPESKIDGKVARHIDRDEMVTNTLNTFTSVTIQCARCHDHKFDPFTQQHYYNLQTIFAAVDRAERVYDVAPSTNQRRIQLASKVAKLREASGALEREITKAGGEELAEARRQVAALKGKGKLKQKHPAYGYHSNISARDALTQKWVQVDLGESVTTQRIVLRPCHDEYAGIGAGFGFPVRFKVEISDQADFKSNVRLLAEESNDFPNPALAAYEVKTSGARGRYVRVTATKLAERSKDYIFALAELQVWGSQNEDLALGKPVAALDSIQAPIRWARKNLTDGIWPSTDSPSSARELAAAQARLKEIGDRVRNPMRQARRQQINRDLAQAEKQLAALPKGRVVYAAATDFKPQGNFKPTKGTPRAIRVLHRGNIQEPRAEAVPGTLPIIAPGPQGAFALPSQHPESARRAALAEWITDHQHPLTWRSIVNRIWQYHFGRGLVDSPNDFGRMGQVPTHPELLDWLACEFRDGRQSIKDMHRLIVTSSVYRQSSAHNARFAAIDGSNQFLWRMNRRRLEAEEIRDAILATSGRLNQQMFGPGYYLFKLEKTTHSPHYEYHKHDPNDAATHRRTVYRFIVRSQPDPFMTTLDCADSSQSTPKRNETLTSLQALSLLNNRFTLVMSEHFARQLSAYAADTETQVSRAVELTMGRAPTVAEATAMTAFTNKHGLPNLCRVLFNASEFTYLD